MVSEKSAEAFRTISEVADDLQVPQHVLRFWEGRFPQIKPVKRAGGRRYYRPEDVELLTVIRDMLYKQGLTIKGVQAALREGTIGDLSDSMFPDTVTESAPAPMESTAIVELEEPDEFDDLPERDTIPALFIRDEELPLLQPILPGLTEPKGLPAKLPEQTRRELAEILTELEQLRFLLRSQN